MYNTKYEIGFNSIDNQRYTIQIKQDGYSGAVTQLTGGVSPITLEYSNEDYLYEPLRLLNGSIKIVTDRILTDLFATTPQQYKVNLLNSANKVIYSGFITPEIYNQETAYAINELSIEFVSALSTLEYIEFDNSNIQISLMDLIKECIVKSNGDYQYIYIPITYGTNTSNILSAITSLSQNLIDEEDKPMNYKDILTEICKILGWTITERDGNIYFIDVDYINNGNNEYWQYNSTLSSSSKVTLSSNQVNISGLTSMAADNNISLLAGYNKINVVCSDYEVEDEDFFPPMEFDIVNQSMKVEYITDDNHVYRKYWGGVTSDFEEKYYNWNGSSFEVATSEGTTIRGNAGCYPVLLVDFDGNNVPNKLEYTNAFEFKQVDENDTVNLLYAKRTSEQTPMIEVSYDKIPTIVIDSDYKIAINFEVNICNNKNGVPYPNGYDISSEGDSWNNNWKIKAKLQIGNYYYNGTSWTTTPSIFDITFNPNDLGNTYNNWVSVKDDNVYWLNVPDLNGYLVNVDRTLIGQPKLSLYNVEWPYYFTTMIADRFNMYSVFVKNIELNIQKIQNNEGNEEKNQDTIYSNVINEEYINELDDVEVIFTTKNNSELSYSKLIYNGEILDTINNKITNTSEKLEKVIIERNVNQYKQPKIKLNQTVQLSSDITPYHLFIDDGNKYIITSESIDYYYNQTTLTLIQVN